MQAEGEHGIHVQGEYSPGVTALSPARVRNILGALQAAWQGHEYDLLARNCNHFCEAFAEMLGVGSLPPWVNRFASQADATVAAVNYASEQTQKFAEDVGNGLSSFGNGILSLFGAGNSAPRTTNPSVGANSGPNEGGGDAKGNAGRRGRRRRRDASQSTATPRRRRRPFAKVSEDDDEIAHSDGSQNNRAARATRARRSTARAPWRSSSKPPSPSRPASTPSPREPSRPPTARTGRLDAHSSSTSQCNPSPE